MDSQKRRLIAGAVSVKGAKETAQKQQLTIGMVRLERAKATAK